MEYPSDNKVDIIRSTEKMSDNRTSMTRNNANCVCAHLHYMKFMEHTPTWYIFNDRFRSWICAWPCRLIMKKMSRILNILFFFQYFVENGKCTSYSHHRPSAFTVIHSFSRNGTYSLILWTVIFSYDLLWHECLRVIIGILVNIITQISNWILIILNHRISTSTNPNLIVRTKK